MAPQDTRHGVSTHALVVALLALGALGASSRLLPADLAITAAAGLLAASLAVVVVPGVLVVLAWRPEPESGLFDVLGAGLGVSIVLGQLCTVVAIACHLPIATVTVGLGTVVAVHAMAGLRSRALVVQVSRAEGLLGLAVVGAGVCLYLVGSPINSTEDAIHIGLVRRLTHLAAPSLENLYIVPGVTYTYPFPASHYLMAAVSHMSGLDPLFVYHKLRAIWGPAALVLLYACARRVFENQLQALAAGAVATGFVLNGSFAAVPGFYWGQLAPYSHASDVAMGVMLPALLLSALQAQQAASRRALIWFMAASAGLVVTLTMTHIREVVQFVAYLGAFTLALLVTRAPRRDVVRAGMLLLLGIVAPLVYDAWHAHAVPDVGATVVRHRQQLREIAAQLSLGDWLRPSHEIIGGYMPAFGALFHAWNPLVLVGGASLVLSARTPGMLLIGSSVLAYALVIRTGALGWAYVYATYFEILYTPARNTIFFVHLMAGALFYSVSASLARCRLVVATAGTAAAVVGVAWGFRALPQAMAARNDLLWWPLVVGYAGAIAVLRWQRGRWGADAGGPPARRAGLSIAITATVAAAALVVSWDPGTSPLNWGQTGTFSTPAALFRGIPCRRSEAYELTYGPPDQPPLVVPPLESCPLPPDLVRFASSQLPAEAVMATDKFDEYAPPMFMPQQVAAWPGQGDGLLDQRGLFRAYFRFFDDAARKHRDQPFFNNVETHEERQAFLDGLHITHVLVNPRWRNAIVPALVSRPDRYRRRFDNGRWSVFEVVR